MTRQLLVGTLLTLLVISCKTEVEINDKWTDQTVVYGVLDPQLANNWVRVERGYLGTEAASASFNKPDSLYYDTLHVTLVERNANGNITDSIVMFKDQSLTPEPGTFTTNGYRIYRTMQKLDDEHNYELVVEKPGTGFGPTTATTDMVQGKGITPSAGFGFRLPRDFSTVVPEYAGRISWFESENAEMYEVDIYFHYKELDTTTNQLTFKSFKIDYETRFGPFENTNGYLETIAGQQALYQAIASNTEVNDNVLRFYDKMVIVIWAGGRNLREFIEYNAPRSGLTQIRPDISRINNGTGVFSSRTRITLDDVDLDNNIESKYYLDPILCDRNFAFAQTSDTCYCEFIGGLPAQRCE